MKKRRLLILSALLVPMMVGTLSTVSCDLKEEDKPQIPDDPVYENDGNYLKLVEKPTKLDYLVGERLSFEGLKIVKYSIVHDVETDPITISEVDYVASIQEGTILEEANAKLTITIGIADKTYEAVSFDISVRERDEYKVTFENHDGTVLHTELVKEGEAVTYGGTTPVKEDVDDVAYRFDGWFVKGDQSQTLINLSTLEVTGPITLVAHFKEGSQSSDGTFVYNLSVDVSHYEVLGFDDNFDLAANTDIVIPSTYNGKPVKKIIEDAFKYEDEITSVVIGKNIEEIGDEAFYGCSAILTVKFEEGAILNKLGRGVFYGTKNCKSIEGIPNTLKSLPKETFKNCGISSIDLGQGIEVIETGAFSGAKNLISLNLPDSVVTIEEEAFVSNDMLETVKIGKGLKNLHPNSKLFEQDNIYEYVVDPENPNFKAVDGILYSKDGKTLVNVPCGYVEPGEDGKVTPIDFVINDEVEVLGKYSLTYHQKDFKNVILGENVKVIDDNAFRYSTSCNIVWNQKLETIGQYAFQGVTGLVGDIVMPDSVTSIDDYAFKGCSKIKTFTFGANMENFGQRIFDGNSTVVLKFSPTNTKLSIEGNVVYDAAKTKCLYWTGVDTTITEYVMPNTVKEVANSFLYGTKLTNLTLSTSLEKIGDSAFSNMSKLKTDLVLPESLTHIGNNAFERTFNSSSYVGSINFPTKVKYIGERAFASTKYLTFNGKVVINENLDFLGDAAFNYSNVEEVEFNHNKLSERLFASCSLLKKVHLSDSITTIAKEAFDSCKVLETINTPASLVEVEQSAFGDCTLLTSFDLSKVKILRKEAFKGTGLTSVTLTDTLELLETAVFNGTTNLTKAVFDLNLERLPDDTFENSGLTEITFPKGLKEIGAFVFYGCNNLVEMAIPEGVTKLGNQGFKNCSKLQKVVLPETLLEIGDYTFEYCVELTSVKLPSKITRLSNSMFKDCEKLANLEIPSSVTEIGFSCFEGTGFSEFALTSGMMPSKTASSQFQESKITKFTFNDGWDIISTNMFKGCSNLVEITGLKEGQLKTIDTGGLQGCSSLETLGFDMSGVTSIGSNAFSNCTSLKSVTLPTNKDFTVISSGTFNKCSSLTELTIPANVTEVKGSNTFAYTTSLTTLTIENPEIKLGSYLCSNSGLTTINYAGTVAQAEKLFTYQVLRVKNVTVHCTDGDYIVK